MQYRFFPQIPEKKISCLGFGLMRLPLKSKDSAATEIDYEKTLELVKTAYENGVNYFDTAYPYHGGKSEVIFGKILKELNIRDKIFIADKMPMWEINSPDDIERIFNEHLSRLETNYIDFYLLHAMNAERWEKVKDFGVLKFLEQKKTEGKIKHLGFSFHDTLETFKKIIDEYPHFEFCQIQHNYFDEDYQAGTEGIEYAANKKIGIIIMEPLRGGLLANPPKQIEEILKNVAQTPASSSLKWLWNKNEIICTLSGMNDKLQILENCKTANDSKANSLSKEQLSSIKEAGDWFRQRIKVPCTGCSYCVPCPKGVKIPAIFAEWNNLSLNGKLEGLEQFDSTVYKTLKSEKSDATQCVQCRACEKQCPQHIKITDVLKLANKALTV